MDSTKGERSISSGISLPQWMKMKITERYDLEQTAFSPPTEDDGFLFMRYPSKSENMYANNPEKNMNTINDVRRKISETKPINEADLNLSQHTVPCRQFISHNYVEPPIQVIKSGPKSHYKSAGVDDGFKTAACGKSVVEVAHQMINFKLYNGRTSEEFCSPTKKYLKQRRNSKSLPASPITSPKTSPKLGRKNPFFTESAFESNSDLAEKNSSVKSRGWLFSSFLSQRESSEDLLSSSRKPSELGSTSSISESVEPMPSNSNVGNTSPKILRAKPSELREMNFWTPTSM